MRELNTMEISNVGGAVDQATAIGVNAGIVGVGVGLSTTMATTGMVLTASGVGIVAGLILISVALTASYILDN